METFPVDDWVATEDDIEWAVKGPRNHRSWGPSGMRANHLKGWISAARKKEKAEAVVGEETTEVNRRGGSTEPTEASNWERVVDLVYTEFR